MSKDSLFAKKLGDKARLELQRLAEMPDSMIDYSDAPAVTRPPDLIRVGQFFRRLK